LRDELDDRRYECGTGSDALGVGLELEGAVVFGEDLQMTAHQWEYPLRRDCQLWFSGFCFIGLHCTLF
jgi:hypothetical protein